jgi:N-acetylglucosamine-6-sulfatase
MNRRSLMLAMMAACLAGQPAVAKALKVTTISRRVVDPRPNILHILLDDQDDHNSLADLTNIKAVGNKGIHWLNSFVDESSCGPSRVSILTGQGMRHHCLRGDSAPHGGFQVFNDTYGAQSLFVALQAAGYRVCVIGRLMTSYIQTSPAPQGVDEYHLLCGTANPFAYRNFWMNDNGVITRYNNGEYSTNVIFQKAADFITAQTGDKPWALFVWPNAPHGASFINPATGVKCDDAPEPDTPDLLVDVGNQPQGAPWDEDTDDKPLSTVGDAALFPPMNPADSNFVWQCRRRAMLSVDRGVGLLDDTMRALGWFNITATFIGADNGYEEGWHRNPGKIMIYDASQRVPGYVRYPGLIPKTGQDRTELVNNLDVTATIFELTAATPLLPLDGRSMVPMFGGALGSNLPVPWRTDILFNNTYTSGVRTNQGELYAETLAKPGYVDAREFYNKAGEDALQMRNRIADRGTGAVKPEDLVRVAELAARLAILKAA